MSRSPLSSLSRSLLLILLGGLAGCGNKGPLFLPPPATQQPEPAATAPAPATTAPAPAVTTEPPTTEPGTTAPPAPAAATGG